MSLAERLKRQFGARDRLRGQDYFDLGRVRLVAAGESSAAAAVAGSRQYAVRFDGSQLKDSGPLFARCECPRYEEGIWCKHVWAAVLALDDEGAELGGGSVST